MPKTLKHLHKGYWKLSDDILQLLNENENMQLYLGIQKHTLTCRQVLR